MLGLYEASEGCMLVQAVGRVMFDRIAILPEQSWDPGVLAETLLLYSEVLVFLNGNSIRALFSRVDPDLLISFFQDHH